MKNIKRWNFSNHKLIIRKGTTLSKMPLRTFKNKNKNILFQKRNIKNTWRTSRTYFTKRGNNQEHSKKNMNIFTKRGNTQEHSKKNMNIFTKRGNTQEHSKKNMNIFSNFHLKILVIRAKLQAFLRKQNERWRSLPFPLKMAQTREEEGEDDGSSWWWWW